MEQYLASSVLWSMMWLLIGYVLGLVHCELRQRLQQKEKRK